MQSTLSGSGSVLGTSIYNGKIDNLYCILSLRSNGFSNPSIIMPILTPFSRSIFETFSLLLLDCYYYYYHYKSKDFRDNNKGAKRF